METTIISNDWTKLTPRNCLRCNRSFMAKGKFLRTCPSCRSINATTYRCAETFSMIDNMRIKLGTTDAFVQTHQQHSAPSITKKESK
jgi:hypothetical protein